MRENRFYLMFFYVLLMFSIDIKTICAVNAEIKPEIALIQEQGGTAVGGLNPEFVLYDNGFVIYGNYYDGYFYTMLTKKEKDKFIDSLRTEKLINLKDNYEITACFGCSTYHLYIWNQNFIKKISAYGDFNSDRFPPKGPSELINALKVLSSFKTTPAKVWISEKIEVEMTGFYKTNKRMAWPKHWPRLKSAEWTKSSNGTYTRVFDRKELKLLKELEKKQQNEIAILLDDELWGTAYRFPFPKEDVWITDIHKYNISYYTDIINKRAKEMEAERIKKNLPAPADRFYDYHQAAKEIKKKLGLKYKVD